MSLELRYGLLVIVLQLEVVGHAVVERADVHKVFDHRDLPGA